MSAECTVRAEGECCLDLSRREALAAIAKSTLAGAIPLALAAEPPGPVCAEPPRPFLHLPVGGTVLFQGDSITDGGRWRDGSDFNHIMGQDYGYIVAGYFGAEQPQWNLNFVNRGVSGNTITDLQNRWQTDTLALKPDVVSILVGVNDAMAAVHGRPDAPSCEQFAQEYAQLIQATMTALPSARLVLGRPFVLPVGQAAADYAQWRAEVDRRGDAVAALAEKHRLPLASYQQVFDHACKRAPAAHWSWDGIHPTYAGHYLMAQTWIQAVMKAR